jgi:hypothetical protein
MVHAAGPVTATPVLMCTLDETITEYLKCIYLHCKLLLSFFKSLLMHYSVPGWGKVHSSRIYKTEINNVAYRHVDKQWLRKQRPFLGNGSINTFPLLESRFLNNATVGRNNRRGVFLCGPCKEKFSWVILLQKYDELCFVFGPPRIYASSIADWSSRTTESNWGVCVCVCVFVCVCGRLG